jgi:membrane associated rhomboid family serine protease
MQVPFLTRRCLRINDRLPLVTSLTIAACLVIFAGINMQGRDDVSVLQRWGYCSASDIWRGAWWGTVTCSFIHIEPMHLLFNLYWVWTLGRVCEEVVGSLEFFIFWIAAAFMGSSTEMVVSGSTGIGASGCGYAIFGFMLAASKRISVFEKVIQPSVIKLFGIWLFVCIGLTVSKIYPIANGAHFGGLIFGLLAAGSVVHHRWKSMARVGLLSLMGLALVPLTYCPWSSAWKFDQGLKAWEDKNFDGAIGWFSKVPNDALEYPWVLLYQGIAHQMKGESEAAAMDYSRLIKMNPPEALLSPAVYNAVAWSRDVANAESSERSASGCLCYQGV